jgi:hypothetical protein
MVFNSSNAKDYFDYVLRISWIFGVIAVYWLTGKIIKDEKTGKENYFKLFLVFFIFIIPVLYLFFGSGYVVELLLGWLWDILSKLILEASKFRLERKQQNIESNTISFRTGLSRGATY